MKRLALGLLLLTAACAGKAPTPRPTPKQTPGPATLGSEIPNAFSPSERSSSGVTGMLLSCMAELQSQRSAGLGAEPHVKGWYCVCMTDAFGIAKQPTLAFDDAGPVCVDSALGTKQETPMDRRTPYRAPAPVRQAFRGEPSRDAEAAWRSGLRGHVGRVLI